MAAQTGWDFYFYFMIKSIDTLYNGNYFRSRMEARWAVFFDEAGIKYQYEPEGFDLGNGLKYLPDFYLPDFSCYAEVKPQEYLYTNEDEIIKHPDYKRWDLFSKEHPLILLFGNPHLRPIFKMPLADEGWNSTVIFRKETDYRNGEIDIYWRFWIAPSGTDDYQSCFYEPLAIATFKRFEHNNR